MRLGGLVEQTAAVSQWAADVWSPGPARDTCPTRRDRAYNNRPFAAGNEAKAVDRVALDADLSSYARRQAITVHVILTLL